MHSSRLAAFVALPLLLLAGTAAADEPVAPPSAPPAPVSTPAEPPAPSRWYGWQTLSADAATALTTVLVVQTGNAGLAATNLGAGFSLGGPIVHLAHGRPLVALGDLAIRAGGVVLGALVAEAAFNCHAPSGPPGSENDDHGAYGICQDLAVAYGGAIAGVAAIVVDASALSWDKPSTGSAATVGRSFTLEPTLTLTRDQAGLGIRGTF